MRPSRRTTTKVHPSSGEFVGQSSSPKATSIPAACGLAGSIGSSLGLKRRSRRDTNSGPPLRLKYILTPFSDLTTSLTQQMEGGFTGGTAMFGVTGARVIENNENHSMRSFSKAGPELTRAFGTSAMGRFCGHWLTTEKQIPPPCIDRWWGPSRASDRCQRCKCSPVIAIAANAMHGAATIRSRLNRCASAIIEPNICPPGEPRRGTC